MIHDLDLLLASVRSEVESVEAVGVNVLTPRTDIANARLRFASGCIANLTASRISRDRVRKARFFQQRLVCLDRLRGAGSRGVPPGQGQRAARRFEGGRLDVAQEEPLQRELADFVDAVRTGGQPASPARAGREALALATRVAEADGGSRHRR